MRLPSGFVGADGHSPQGECGLKLQMTNVLSDEAFGHSPQGECGLKLVSPVSALLGVLSLPARGVWIEISSPSRTYRKSTVTPRKGSVD